MQFEIQTGTDYSTVKFNHFDFSPSVSTSLLNSFNKIGGEKISNTLWKFPSFITAQILEEVIHNTCFVCGGLMQNGQALDNTWVYFDDFGNDVRQYGTTCSKIGTPVMKRVRKCSSCGHTHT